MFKLQPIQKSDETPTYRENEITRTYQETWLSSNLSRKMIKLEHIDKND